MVAARAIAVAILALALGLQVVRTAAMQRPGPRVAVGARMWPSHPAVIIDLAMAEIGASARRGQAPSPKTLGRIDQIAVKTPLAPEPFLVHGAIAQANGQERRAEQLFTEARARDPRSEAARYFLADRYLRAGRIAQALSEMAVFARLIPGASDQFAPALASYARTPGALSQLRAFFGTSPEFRPPVLAVLAGDARNASLILALAGPAGGAPQPWQAKIVSALFEQRQYAKAYAVWTRISGERGDGRGLFNADFRPSNAPPPFNWAYATRGGVAEPAINGRLQVIYYGREDAVLAQQMLLLQPGRYRLAMEVDGQPGDGTSVGWSLSCLPQNNRILSLTLRQGQKAISGEFSVPSGCAAQRLELNGSIGDFPQSIEFAIGKLHLVRVAGE